jgi:hypothetical protein
MIPAALVIREECRTEIQAGRAGRFLNRLSSAAWKLVDKAHAERCGLGQRRGPERNDASSAEGG